LTDRPRSEDWYKRAEEVIPSGVNSPVRAFGAVGGHPPFIEKGAGGELFDYDGNRYIDLCCSWGPLILGHAHPEVIRSINHAAALGASFGATTGLEVELAEMVTSRVKSLDKVRFVSSGTEAVMSAVRVARGFTGRDKIIKFNGCYHGHCDYLLVKAGSGLATFGQPSSGGVPEGFAAETLVADLDDPESVQAHFDKFGDDIAAVLIEPIPANNGLLHQTDEFLKFLRDITRKQGALLIFDEVISGFRIGWGGAAEKYGIEPDLMTFGKVIGGGMPVGGFGGKADIMDVLAPKGPVYQAGTLSGNPVAMAAGLTTLRVLERENGFARLEKLGAHFEQALRENIKKTEFSVAREGSIVWLAFQKELPRRADRIESEAIEKYNSHHRAILDRGVYLPPSGYEVMFVSTAHNEAMLSKAAEIIGESIDNQ